MIEVQVAATPAPQGSKNCSCKGGKAIMFEQTSKHLRPFRKAVTAAARAVMNGRPPLDGPLALEVTFTLERPASTKYPDAPAGTPDLSKLLRALEDSFTDAGVWADDARVVSLRVRKVWTGSPGALPFPGCLARVASSLPLG